MIRFKYQEKPLPSMHPDERKCSVCGETAHLFSPNSDPVCLRVECKHVIEKKKTMSPGKFTQYFSLQSEQIKCNIQQTALKTKKIAEQREKEEKEYVDYMMKMINKINCFNPTVYPYTILSKNTRHTAKLPRSRKMLFRNFLSSLVNEVYLEAEANNDRNAEFNERQYSVEAAPPIEAKACAVCRGICCNTGGKKNAYIKKDTILRYMSEHPGQKPMHILAAYMEHIGEKTVTESCVYHTETGCCLPRTIRSDTCNEFLCDSLIKLDERLNKTPASKAIFLIESAQKNRTKKNLKNEIGLGSKIGDYFLIVDV